MNFFTHLLKQISISVKKITNQLNVEKTEVQKKRNINTKSGNYTEKLEGDYIQSKVTYIIQEPTIKLIDDPARLGNQKIFFSQEQDKLVTGNIIYDEHKFHGKLAIIAIELCKINYSKRFCIKLTVSFGTLEVKIPKYLKKSNYENETIDIEIGIKKSNLCFNLKNGLMPLNKRNSLKNKANSWQGIFLGESQSPEWQFELLSRSISKKQSQILRGNLANEVLGILEIIKANACCIVEASLEISINRNYIEIINFDDGSNKKQKETKIALLLQYLKSELRNLDNKISLSKVAKEYDTETIS